MRTRADRAAGHSGAPGAAGHSGAPGAAGHSGAPAARCLSGRRARGLGAAFVVALGVLGLARWSGPARAGDGAGVAPGAAVLVAPARGHEDRSVRAAATLPVAGGGESGGDAPLPRSLEGTEVDGGLDVGADGHLVLGPRVIALFDYFFAATGEESEAAIRDRIRAYSRKHLVDPALGEALALLDRYVGYRAAAGALRAGETSGPAARLAALGGLRRAHFGADAEALFGAEERSTAAAIDKAAAGLDKGLSPDERDDRRAEVDERLPAAEREARAAATRVLQLREDEAALRAAGADEGEVHKFRAGTLGEEAAARLEALDQQRAAWKQRVEAFRREREERCGGGPEGTRAACEAALLQASFDAQEQLRVRAILATD